MESMQGEWLRWDPNPVIFELPFIGKEITWYGLLFSLGVLLSYFVTLFLVRRHFSLCFPALPLQEIKKKAQSYVDTLAWFVLVGVVVGARLGHVFFYGWPHYQAHPMDIFKIWEGGLASHGGAVGVILATFLYSYWVRKKVPQFSFLLLCDVLAVSAGLAGAFIRIGNFINQEVLGKVTLASWGIVFLHPLDGSPALPRHPVQIYESVFYFLVFLFLFVLWSKKEKSLREGSVFGGFLFLVFSFRFCIEFIKAPQSLVLESSASKLLMGQYLSIPFIIFGVLLMLWGKPKSFS